jgi:integrase
MKTRSGHLFKRNGNWYCRVNLQGKVISRLLHKPDGTPCRIERDAEAARVEFMRPFTTQDKLDALQTIAGRIEGVKAEIAKIEDAEHPPLTIDGAWPAFLAYLDGPKRKIQGQRSISPSAATLPMYANIFKQFREWLFKHHPNAVNMRDVTEKMADVYATYLNKRRLSPSRYNKHRMFLTMIFRILATPAKLTSNPFEGLAVAENTSSNYHRELTVEELIRVAGAAQGELRILLAEGIYTGLRLGDCATLRWAEVDLIRGQIKRTPHKTARRHPDPITIPIHRALLQMLAAIPERANAEYVLPQTASLYIRSPTELVRKIQAHFVACGIRTIRPGTGVETVIGKDGKPVKRDTGKHPVVEVGFHSLRHTFVSLSRSADAPLAVVEGLVGHSSPAMTRHYTHTSDAARRTAIDSLPDISAKTTPPALPPAVPPPETPIAPDWVVEKLATMTAKNWEKVRDEISKHGRSQAS